MLQIGYYNCYAVGFIKTPTLVTYFSVFSTKDNIFMVNQYSYFSTNEAYYNIANFNYLNENIHYCDCHLFFDYHTELIATTQVYIATQLAVCKYMAYISSCNLQLKYLATHTHTYVTKCCYYSVAQFYISTKAKYQIIVHYLMLQDMLVLQITELRKNVFHSVELTLYLVAYHVVDTNPGVCI